MGLFGKIFEKKECAFCGAEIGLLGNRKLEDGNMCKECASKLSYWFDDRRHSTVEAIQTQLDYREQNKQEVAAFRCTRTYGEDWKLWVSEEQGKFMLVRTGDHVEENPDVIDASQVRNVETKISESRDEETYEDSEGNEVSYDPPMYRYRFDFDIVIEVDHPYFDTLRFQVNDRGVETTVRSRQGFFLDDPDEQAYKSYEYRRYADKCTEIEDALRGLGKGQQVGSSPQQAAVAVESSPSNAPTAKAAFCGNCGAAAGVGNFCEFCGAPLA